MENKPNNIPEGNPAGIEPTPAPTGAEPTAKTYTEEDVAGLRSQWQQELAEQLKQAKAEGMSEAERFAKLTAEEQMQEQLKTLRAENETLKKNDARARLEAEALKTLEAEALPTSFRDLVMAEDAETIKTRISTLKTAFTTAVQQEVESRLKGKAPAVGGGIVKTEEEALQETVKQIIEGGR